MAVFVPPALLAGPGPQLLTQISPTAVRGAGRLEGRPPRTTRAATAAADDTAPHLPPPLTLTADDCISVAGAVVCGVPTTSDRSPIAALATPPVAGPRHTAGRGAASTPPGDVPAREDDCVAPVYGAGPCDAE